MNTQTTDHPKPNILLFFTDDQRHDTLAALGNDEIRTPNVDRLVETGTAFTNAHVMGGMTPAICMPSRAMLMTGRTLFHLQGQGQHIPRNHTLLGEWLQSAGYNTFGTGKWHNSTESYARSFSAGAEIFFGGMEDHWNVPACHFDPTGRYDVRSPITLDPHHSNRVTLRLCDHVTVGKHSSELFCDAAIDYLGGYDDDRPFFMYISFMAPHDPRTMPEEYRTMYEPEDIKLPANYMPEHPFDHGNLRGRDEMLEGFPRTPHAIRRHIAEYYAMISHADAQIGRVLQALRASGQYDNTVVVFAGDNGLAVGCHGLMGKQNMYQHSVGVPLIMTGPGIPSGKTRDGFCYLLDIFPTLCDLIGIPTPDSVEGRSLAPVMHDSTKAIRETLYFGFKDVQRAVRDRRYKLIEYVVEGNRTTQLFDVLDDPNELINIAGNPEYAPVLSRLREELLRQRDELEAPVDERGQAFWEGYSS